ncbi:MAG: thermostable hemolysin [Stellaceae bacterium]
MLLNCAEFCMTFWDRDISIDRTRFTDVDIIGERADQRVILASLSHSLRAQAEACIRTVYKRVFGARDLVFPGTLAALVDDKDRPLCAAGLRTAGEGFFSEIYLDAPIERILSARSGRSVAREAVFEVTTLASRSAEASPRFLRHLAILGKSAGFEWSFFTATARLRALLGRLGGPILDLGPADPQRLANAERWGSYYAHSPRVCAVHDQWLEDGAARPREGLPHA